MSPYESPHFSALVSQGARTARRAARHADRAAAADPVATANQPASWLGRAQPLVLGPADNPIATLTRHALLYKSDSRGLYLVVRSQWQLRGPLQEGDKVRVELLNERGERIDQLSQPVDKRQLCRKGRCTLNLNSTLRAPDDALASRYQLRIGLLLKERPESGEFSQICRPCRSGVSTSPISAPACCWYWP